MENISKERYIVFKNLNLGELRTLKEKGEHGYNQFVLNDVCQIINMDIKNALRGIKNNGLSNYASVKYMLRYSSNRHGEFEREIDLNVVEEPALFYLISIGRSQACQAFRIWLYGDVLPALMQHGGYIMTEDRDKYKGDPDKVKDLIRQLESERRYTAALLKECERLRENNERIETNAWNYDKPIEEIDQLEREILNNDNLKMYEIINKLDRIRIDMQLAVNSLQRPEML